MKNILRIYLLDTRVIILLIILVAHLFFRFFDIENRNQFTWDQVDNAWAAKTIIVDHRFPLVGPVIKQNTGFFIGPLYYYLITPFYSLFNLDPIASGVFAGITSVFTFFVIFFVTKKIFSFNVALIAVFIHTFSLFIIQQERVQWNVNFVESISLIILYSLYMVINKKINYLILLAIALGLSFHVHFTSTFFPIIILLAFPLFPKDKMIIKYSILGFLLFIGCFVPSLANELISKESASRNMIQYIQSYYHGFHLTRFLQLLPDAFIEFEEVLGRMFKFLRYIILPVFIFLYLSPMNKKKFALCYLMILWILVPWIVFSTYSGEISNYYFALTRPVVILSLSFITWKLLESRLLLVKFLPIVFWAYYVVTNISGFFVTADRPLSYYKSQVRQSIKEGKTIEFSQFLPESYIYYVYKRNENISKTNTK